MTNNQSIKKMLVEATKVNGAVSTTELAGIVLTAAKEMKSQNMGIAVDFGSHAGRSSMAGVLGLSSHLEVVDFFMVDLLYDLTNPEWENTTQKHTDNIPWGYAKAKGFIETVYNRVEKYRGNFDIFLMGKSSLQFLRGLKTSNTRYNYVFIDSDDHQEELVMEEVKELEDKMNQGGLIFFHDFRNQYIGPQKAYVYLRNTGKYEEVLIDWEAAKKLAIESGTVEDPNSWHMPGVEFPCFVGCLRRI